MTNPLSELSAIVEAVPPGTKCRVQLVHEADGHVIPNGAVAAYVETGTRLTRWLCSPGAVEELARLIDPSSWRVFDGYLADVKRKYKNQNAAYDPEAFKDKKSTAVAVAILTTLAQHALEERT